LLGGGSSKRKVWWRVTVLSIQKVIKIVVVATMHNEEEICKKLLSLFKVYDLKKVHVISIATYVVVYASTGDNHFGMDNI